METAPGVNHQRIATLLLAAAAAGCGSSDCDCAGPPVTIAVVDADGNQVTADEVRFAVNGCDEAQATCVNDRCALWSGELFCMREGEDTVSVRVTVTVAGASSTSEHTLELVEAGGDDCCPSYEDLRIEVVPSP